jgi:hypothetical protein
MKTDVILSKEACEILGWGEDKKGYSYFFDSLNKFKKYLNGTVNLPEKDFEILVHAAEANAKWWDEATNCVVCKESLAKPNGSRCATHFHDYQACFDAHCIGCLIHRSVSAHFPEAADKYLGEW